MSKETRLDERDLSILKALKDDAWLTHAKIGSMVNLSASAVQRRIERMRKSGVINGAHADIDWSQVNRRTRMYFLLELQNDSASYLDQLAAKLRAHPEVNQVELIAGRFDILVTVDCQSAEQFFEVTMEILNKDENVKHVWSLTRLKKFL